MRIATIMIAALALAGVGFAVPEASEAAQKGSRAKGSVYSKNKATGRNHGTKDRRPVRVDNNQGNKTYKKNNKNRKNNTVIAGNTVVVNRGHDRGYDYRGYDRDRYDRWDDDDDDFFEVVGKAAAVTAGVAVTAAVIGEIVEDEPDGCQQSVYYGQTYLYCNGVWYQPVMAGSNVQYVVVNNPG